MEAQLLAMLLMKGMEFAQVMAQAKAENREVSADEIEAFRASLMDSDRALASAIEQARAEGR